MWLIEKLLLHYQLPMFMINIPELYRFKDHPLNLKWVVIGITPVMIAHLLYSRTAHNILLLIQLCAV